MSPADDDPRACASADVLDVLRENVRSWDRVRPAGAGSRAYVAQCARLARIALAAVELDLVRQAVPMQVPGQLAIDVDEAGR